MTTLSIRNLWKEYGDQVVLESVSLEVTSPAFVTIVGASGCGKSTFLRILLGQESATRGQVLIDDASLPTEPDASRGIVFQRYSVFPHLNVLDNVTLGLEFEHSRLLGRCFGRGRAALRERARTMLAAVGLGDSTSRYPAELSGGMRQRLAIAQAIVKEPAVLLLDEPFGALDPGTRRDMHALIHEIWNRHSMLVFMVTHDLREAFELGTRLLVFDKPRSDPQAPHRYGATLTYDLVLNGRGRADAMRIASIPSASA